jgi:hypothetical protein
MKQYAKAIVALIGGVAAWAATAIVDGHVTPAEWAMLAGVVATAAGVYQVRNAPTMEASDLPRP